ncbi:hypothetical protein ACJO1P_27970 [Vibrio parahaemolyticus]|uniref:hypothetical protein n=1 Tax=Vibrio parahaemolyticus TaxID=670 RepID=UPI00387B209B
MCAESASTSHLSAYPKTSRSRTFEKKIKKNYLVDLQLWSIANWTYREFTPDKFRQSQAKKGAKGGKIGGKISKRKPVESSERTLKPWEELGIHRATYYRKKEKGLL